MTSPVRPTLTSPCTGICKYNASLGLCSGCARSGDEIGRWSGSDASYRERVWRELVMRRRALRLLTMRPNWTAAQIAAQLTNRLNRGQELVFGDKAQAIHVEGAAGSSSLGVESAKTLIFRTASAGFSLTVSEAVRAFSVAASIDACHDDEALLVLAVPRLSVRSEAEGASTAASALFDQIDHLPAPEGPLPIPHGLKIGLNLTPCAVIRPIKSAGL